MGRLLTIVFFILLFLSPRMLPAQDGNAGTASVQQLLQYSLEELLQLEISTPTKIPDAIQDQPSTIIVITKEQIRLRGYNDISEIFNDLPGMDVVRPYGSTYFYNYVRGFRASVGDRYILMLDGMQFNQLYYNDAQKLSCIPVSNIERIEVIYGPGSSVYGANAMMGIVNVVTKTEMSKNGDYINAKLSRGIKNYYYGDFNYFYKKDDLRVSISGHADEGNLNDRVNQADYTWINDEVYANKKLWGGLTDNSNVGGSFSSPIRLYGIDGRVFLKNTEIGMQYFHKETGTGTANPADRFQSAGNWTEPDLSVYAKHTANLSDKLNVQTLFRYRTSDVKNTSLVIRSFDEVNNDSVAKIIGGTIVQPGGTIRVDQASYYQSLNSSISFFMDLNYGLSDRIKFAAGIKFENRNLQKAFDISAGPITYADSLNLTNGNFFPVPPEKVYQYQNREIMYNQGGYLQTKINFLSGLDFFGGTRYEHNNIYGSVVTTRGALVGKYNRIICKLIYGEGFQEPPPRTLYGSFPGAGSSPNLLPERSKTYEVSTSYKAKRYNALVSIYDAQSKNIIQSFDNGARNLGEREVIGMDIHFTTDVMRLNCFQLTGWAYYSAIFRQQESKFDNATGNPMGEGIVGDIANNKFWLGISSVYNGDKFCSTEATLQCRLIGARETVPTNPIHVINAYTVVDANVCLRNVFQSHLSFSCKITNLFNEVYSHPGIRLADAGTTPGSFNSNGVWTGSNGSYNSKLPQPERFIILSLSLEL